MKRKISPQPCWLIKLTWQLLNLHPVISTTIQLQVGPFRMGSVRTLFEFLPKIQTCLEFVPVKFANMDRMILFLWFDLAPNIASTVMMTHHSGYEETSEVAPKIKISSQLTQRWSALITERSNNFRYFCSGVVNAALVPTTKVSVHSATAHLFCDYNVNNTAITSVSGYAIRYFFTNSIEFKNLFPR